MRKICLSLLAATTLSACAATDVSHAASPRAAPRSEDFPTRCAAPRVVKCVGFDADSDLAGAYGDNAGVLPNSSGVAPALDTDVKASGASSLRFTIPSNSSANSSGSWFTNFSPDLATQFGASTQYYVQWRQRFSPEFLSAVYAGGGGWKQVIIGSGDKPGTLYASCTDLEVVTQNTGQRGFPQMYNSCNGSASHGSYFPFEERLGASDFKLQNARPVPPGCLYSQGDGRLATGNCIRYYPNEWMTFQVGVKTGPRVGDEWQKSTVRLWVAREGRPSRKVIEFNINLSAGSAALDQKFGKIWLLPYHTGKDPSQAHRVGFTWYDELIISGSPIADPSGTPPAPAVGR
jgi:hypothetical protein